MDAMSTLGSRLREERKRLGLLQPAFAELGGVKRVTQHLYEQDERVPDANYLLQMHAHGVDVTYVLLGTRKTANAIAIDMNALCDIYRAIDDFARNDMGEPLAIEERLRLFSLLTLAQSGGTAPTPPADLHRRLMLCLSVAA
ncbi:MAG: helix-turn-helix transcriptional regulator [Rhodocyclaceae bacterium]|nr:helix-turn-helix transcriptional regulator [Rhodocyclaceae bacterium]